MKNLTPDEKNLLITLLHRGLEGGETEVYLRDNWGRKKTPDIHIPEDKHGRIELAQKSGDRLTEMGYLTYDKANHRWKISSKGIELALQDPSINFEPLDVEACLTETLDRAVFHPLPKDDPEYPGETPIPWLYQPGDCRLVLVLGENAGGKSFFRRVLQFITHWGRKGHGWGDNDIPRGPFPVRELIHISMEGRTAGGIVSGFVYGTEKWRSTGENSANTVRTGITTAEGRGHTSIMYWDEPDIGMSAGTAAGAGQTIRDFVREANPLVQMICVTSHSPALVQQLRDLNPHYIYLGDANGPATLDDWFEYQVNPRPVTPDEVLETSHHRYRLINRILKG